MAISRVDIQSRFVNALRTQASHKAERSQAGSLPCPYGHQGMTIQSVEQLLGHAKSEDTSELVDLEKSQARRKVRDEAIKYR